MTWRTLKYLILLCLAHKSTAMAKDPVNLVDWVEELQFSGELYPFSAVGVIKSWQSKQIQFLDFDSAKFNRFGLLNAIKKEDAELALELNRQTASPAVENSCAESLEKVAICLAADALLVQDKIGVWVLYAQINQKFTRLSQLILGEHESFEDVMQARAAEALGYHGIVMGIDGEFLLLRGFPLSYPKLIQGLILANSHDAFKITKTDGAGLLKLVRRLGPYSVAKVLVASNLDQVLVGTKVILEEKK